MTPIQQQLAVEYRTTVALAIGVAEQVLSNPPFIFEIVDCLEFDNDRLKARAARVVELVANESPELIDPFRDRILDEYALIPNWIVRTHLSKVIPMLTLDGADVDRAFQVYERHLEDKSSIVRTLAMQGMVDLLERAPGRESDVRERIESLMENGTPAMRARGKRLLTQLEGQESAESALIARRIRDIDVNGRKSPDSES